MFDLQKEIARATSRLLSSPEYWKQQGIPMPQKYLLDFEIPASIRKQDDVFSVPKRGIFACVAEVRFADGSTEKREWTEERSYGND